MTNQDPAPRARSRSLFQEMGRFIWTVWRGSMSIVTALRAAVPYLLGGSSADLRKEVTEHYPDPISSRTAEDLPARSRGLVVNDVERCTGCGDCVKVCPTACIDLEAVEVPATSKKWVSVFDLDYSKCVFCGLCVEACNPNSLSNSRRYELAVDVLGEAKGRFGRGKVSAAQVAKWEAFRAAGTEYRNFT